MLKPYSSYIAFMSCLLATGMLFSCKSGSVNLFKPASPHEQYQRKLQNSGLDQSSMGRAWLNASTRSLEKALRVVLPFKETGYFSAEKIPAIAFKFKAAKGERLSVALSKKTSTPGAVYVDLWQLKTDTSYQLIQSADTLGNPLKFDVEYSGEYLLRLQPELLSSIEYTIEIGTGPSLGFPTKTGRNQIKSYYGDGRDENSRKHEGIDIFGTFRSPVVATSNGTVNRVNENNLGGKVVWFRPEGKDYTLYYAHLDEQIAREGQTVLTGDTLGLMGNTGNAKTTPPHLHFGIYTRSGAVDPLPYIAPAVSVAEAIVAPLHNLNKTLRTTAPAKVHAAAQIKSPVLHSLPTGTILDVQAATGNWYRIDLPDGSMGFIQNAALSNLSKPIRQIQVSGDQLAAHDRPDLLAPTKLSLRAGQRINLMGTFGKYQLIQDENQENGWILK